MKGLIYKDFAMLMSAYKKNLLLVAALYGGMAIMLENDFLLYFGIWMMGFYGLTGFSMDTQSGWGRYARTLPVQDWKLMASKFITGLLFMGIGVAYSLVVGVFCRVISGTLSESWGEMLFVTGIITAAAVACMGLMYFLAVKFSPDKARSYFMLVFMVTFFGFFLLGKSGVIGELPVEGLQSLGLWLDSHLVLTVLGVLVIAGLVLVICAAAACAVYRKKEF